MTLDTPEAKRWIAHNTVIHDRVARKYEALHGEIFNDIEQARLQAVLGRAVEAVRTGTDPLRALDFGCGSGNLTRYLLNLELHVTAADISSEFLQLVERRYGGERLTMLHMAGGSLASIPDEEFDCIAVYSVLHHIPDYLAAIRELARVCKKGGILLLDHEPTEGFWQCDPIYKTFQTKALRFDWRKYFVPSNYLHKVRRLFNPRYTNEGDIHVWPDDHIEWSCIKALLISEGFEVVHDEDYLLYRKLYRREVYQAYVGRCTDTKVMIFRKRSE